ELGDAVHGEGARTREPHRISRSLVEREERVPVPRRAVTEVASLAQRPGGPDRLAAGEQQRVELVARESAETHGDARRAVAVLHERGSLARELRPPVRENAVAGGGLRDGLRDARAPAVPLFDGHELAAGDERCCGSDEAVHGSEIGALPSEQILDP